MVFVYACVPALGVPFFHNVAARVAQNSAHSVLERQWRMRCPQEFHTTIKKGSIGRCQGITLHYYHSHPGRIGFIVPKKKCSPLAVKRNRIKRQLRHIAYEAIKSGAITVSDMIVVRVDRRILQLSFDQLTRAFLRALNRARNNNRVNGNTPVGSHATGSSALTSSHITPVEVRL